MQIIFSSQAENDLDELLEFLMTTWNLKVRNKFLKKMHFKFIQLKAFPKSCPVSLKENIYKCVLTKQTSFFYRINKSEIEIIAFIDNRQNPKKVKDKF